MYSWRTSEYNAVTGLYQSSSLSLCVHVHSRFRFFPLSVKSCGPLRHFDGMNEVFELFEPPLVDFAFPM